MNVETEVRLLKYLSYIFAVSGKKKSVRIGRFGKDDTANIPQMKTFPLKKHAALQ